MGVTVYGFMSRTRGEQRVLDVGGKENWGTPASMEEIPSQTKGSSMSTPEPTPVLAADQAVLQVIANAFQDQNFANQLLADPATTFEQGGFDVPDELHTEFNDFFSQVDPDLITTLNDPARRNALPDTDAVAAGFRCTLCKIQAWSLALSIVAVGAAALATLTVRSGIVVAVASYAAIRLTVALAFLRGLGAAIVAGVSAVAQRLCGLIGAC